MNIFVTDDCPIQCAKNLDDARVVKLVLESAQMLSTAINLHGGTAPYKTAYKNHPCTIWTRTTRSNFMWLYKHYIALSAEYTARFGKVHKSSLIAPKLLEQAHLIPAGPRLPFANCAANKSKGISYKHIDDVTQAYKLYLMDRWESDVRTPRWYGVK